MQGTHNNEFTARQPVKHDMGAMHNASVPWAYFIASAAYFRLPCQNDEACVLAVDLARHLSLTPTLQRVGGNIDDICLRLGQDDYVQLFGPADFKPSAGHHRQVRIRGLAARLGQHAMNLAAMVRLVIEEMRHEQPARL